MAASSRGCQIGARRHPAALAACSTGDTASSDTKTADPMAPAALTAAQVAGAWQGTSRPGENEAVTDRWTMMSTSDSTGTLVFDDAQSDSIPFAMRFEGDSVIMTSSRPCAGRDGKAMYMYRQVGRLEGDRLVGHVEAMPADRPDSVVGRYTWEATRAP